MVEALWTIINVFLSTEVADANFLFKKSESLSDNYSHDSIISLLPAERYILYSVYL